MCEKRVESLLTKCLKPFDQKYIYYSPSENEELKNLFKHASKNDKNNHGIPDRIYYDGETIIIFECKAVDINIAIQDLKIYKEKMTSNNLYVYFVAFVANNYLIYNYNFNEINKKLVPNTFNIQIDSYYNRSDMSKDLHKIHNYIRDYTKISNEDKSFFIACILISLKKESFIEVIKKYDFKKYIYDFIQQNLIEFNIDISVFEFLRNDENNKHFLNIINMIYKVYKNNPSNDLLNYFYSEFVKYNNSDGKSLGIVLTPHHIVQLMIKLLDIKESDIFLDLCSGTGSFPIETLKYNPRKIIACEYQNKLYTLLKCNMILRNISLIENDTIKGDCFDNKFKATKSAINPPYGMKDKKELDFIIKQLESIEEGGLVCAIIPKSKISSNSTNNKLKKKIMSIGIVKIIINCNPKVFYPNAGVECCIILIEKNKKGHSGNTKILSYKNDGFIIKKQHGMVKTMKFDEKYDNLLKQIEGNFENTINKLTASTTWFLNKNLSVYDDDEVDYIKNFKLKNLEHKFYLEKQELLKEQFNPLNTTYKLFKISELFTIKRGGKKMELNEGCYPYISSTSLNNGITKYVDKYIFQDCITVANNGSIGCSFYQQGKFYCSSDVTALTNPKEEINDVTVLLYICSQLELYKNKYSYGFKWTLSRMKDDKILLPVKDGKVNKKYIYEI